MRPATRQIRLGLGLILVCAGIARADDPPAKLEADVARRLLATAEALDAPEDRSEALRWAATLLQRAGDGDAAQAAWEKAVAEAERIPIDQANHSTFNLIRIAEARYRAGDRDGARATMNKARTRALDMPSPIGGYVEIGNILATERQAGDEDMARTTYELLRQVLDATEDPTLRAIRPNERVRLLARMGRFREVLDAIINAEPPPGTPEENFRSTLLETLAIFVQTQPQDKDEAGPVLLEALPLVYGIGDGRQRGQLLCNFAKALARVGRVDEAQRIVETIPEEAEFDDGRGLRFNKTLAMQEVADALLKAGRRGEALQLCDDAVIVMEPVEDISFRTHPLSTIARTQAEAGEMTRARATLAKIGKTPPAGGLMMLADIARRRGDEHTARELLSEARRAAEAQRQAPDVPAGEPDPDQTRRLITGAASQELVSILARQGEFDAAEAQARAITSERYIQQNAWGVLASARLEREGVPKTLAWIDTLDNSQGRATALRAVAGALTRPKTD
jgi:tetratricopeptide (TPR) repeat protein